MTAHIIDIHQHPYPGVHEIMDTHRIRTSVLLPGPGQNRTVLEWARKWPGMFVPFYWLDLADPAAAADDLERAVTEDGHRGVKFQPLVQHFYANEPRLAPVFERAQKLGVPVLFHQGVVGFDKHYAQYGTCVYADELADTYGDLKIILAHLGGNYSFEAVVIAAKHPNVYLDTAYLHFFCDRSLPKVTPLEMIRRAVEFAGPGKVLYGGEGTTPTMILDSDLRQDCKKRILWQNAQALLGLDEPEWAAEDL